MTIDDLVELLSDQLKPLGFRRERRNWRRAGKGGVSQIVNLQGSQYGSQIYVNIGLWLDAVEEPPKNFLSRSAHVGMRAGSLVGYDREFVRMSNFELSDVSSMQRREYWERFVSGSLIPLLQAATTVKGIRELPASVLTHAMIRPQAEELIWLNGGRP